MTIKIYHFLIALALAVLANIIAIYIYERLNKKSL